MSAYELHWWLAIGRLIEGTIQYGMLSNIDVSLVKELHTLVDTSI